MLMTTMNALCIDSFEFLKLILRTVRVFGIGQVLTLRMRISYL